MTEIKTPPVRVIRKVEEYIVNNVGKVAILTAVNPEKALQSNEPLSIYQGFAVLGVRLSNGEVTQIPVEFELDVANIDEAFEKFQDVATEQLQKQMADAQKVLAVEQEKAKKREQAERQKIVIAPPGMKVV